MKKLLLLLFVVFSFYSWAQTDTLREENMRKVADKLFMNLDQGIYGESLLNRSFSTNKVIKEQINGNYNQIHGVIDFLNMYSDAALSYVDSTYMMTNQEAANTIDRIFRTNELITAKDKIITAEDGLIQPFGLMYHFTSYIDSAIFTTDNFSAENHSYIPLINEDQLYDEVLIKSCASLEFYPESGYRRGKLQYVPSLISQSPDIENLSLRIDVGNGFVDFNESNSLISYDRTQDSLIGHVAVSFQKNNTTFTDTLQFYLTTVGEKGDRIDNKAIDTWDWEDWFNRGGDISFEYGVRTGCGNTDGKLRRPIIMVAPYRPTVQPFSMKKYFTQFNFKSLISSLADMGYDVIFIKQHDGNASLEEAGEVLASFIRHINYKKQDDYPGERWENILIGFSMGGQIARYALKLMEYEHMLPGSFREHPHTRLYIPYDSPHLGANIPMFAQFVYKDLKNSSIYAHLAYNSLVDEASKDMSASHVIGSVPSTSSAGNMDILTYNPSPTSERVGFINALHNNFNHQFTPLNDLRTSYPTFSRNVAVSTGRNDQNYSDEFGLNPGQLLFSQNALTLGVGGLLYKNRKLYSSKYSHNQSVFRNQEKLSTLLIPITLKDRDYRTNYALEWDMSQGGYKDQFYDAPPIPILPFIATGAVPILRINAKGFGQKYYSDHMNFLPLVSALGINPNIWQNNDLFFDMRAEGLMFENYQDLDNNIRSELFGYPHLAHPSNHFDITPFEAVYADPQTYEHIKMQKSIEDNPSLSDVYLVHTRNFILDEVESDVVALQNKVIGKNHNQGLSNYKYEAWYKAYRYIIIGNKVTPKTDPGDYIIEETGDITVYARDSVSIQSGFHAQPGSNFHAFIHYDGCSRPRGKSKSSGQNESASNASGETSQGSIDKDDQAKRGSSNTIVVYPNPNSGKFKVVIPSNKIGGKYSIVNNSGITLKTGIFHEQNEKTFDLPNGIYYFQWRYGDEFAVKKIIVL